MFNDNLKEKLAYTVSILTTLLSVFITVFLASMTFTGYGLVFYSWHPPLMSIGMLLLMTQAIAVFSGDHYLLGKTPLTKNRFRIHWILQALAAGSVLVAFICVWFHKVETHREHFQSIHAITGLIACILWLVSIANGVVTAYAAELRNVIRPVILKFLHGFLGAGSYGLGMVSATYGIAHPSTQHHLSMTCIYGLNGIVAVIGISTVLSPLLTVGRRADTILRAKV